MPGMNGIEVARRIGPRRFVQVHRSAIVCLERVSHFVHGKGESGELFLKGRSERVPVSRSCQHLFNQM